MTRKLDKTHLDEIESIRNAFGAASQELGSIALERYALNKRLAELIEAENAVVAEYEKLRIQETNLLDAMRARYGEGSVDISTGTFTPDSGLDK